MNDLSWGGSFLKSFNPQQFSKDEDQNHFKWNKTKKKSKKETVNHFIDRNHSRNISTQVLGEKNPLIAPIDSSAVLEARKTDKDLKDIHLFSVKYTQAWASIDVVIER